VVDVAWAPFSSTAFAAITNDGRVLLYDIAVSKVGLATKEIGWILN
jgi:hypothetical protein